MKKTLVFAGLLALISLTACKKDYNCSCTYNYGSGDTTLTFLYENASKSDAEEACDATQATYQIIDANASCSLD